MSDFNRQCGKSPQS